MTRPPLRGIPRNVSTHYLAEFKKQMQIIGIIQEYSILIQSPFELKTIGLREQPPYPLDQHILHNKKNASFISDITPKSS